MIDWALFVSFSATLLAVLDPIGNLPIFIGMTQKLRPGVRRGVAVILSGFVALTMLVLLVTGLGVLSFFGISIPAFKIAGGICLLLVGLSMMKGDNFDVISVNEAEEVTTDFREARAQFGNVLVPLGIPFFIGPSSISAVVLFGARAKGTESVNAAYAALTLAILACSVVTLVTLMSAGFISRLLGRTGLTVVTRIMGMIVTAMAVQFVLSGAASVMPEVIKPDLIAPGIASESIK